MYGLQVLYTLDCDLIYEENKNPLTLYSICILIVFNMVVYKIDTGFGTASIRAEMTALVMVSGQLIISKSNQLQVAAQFTDSSIT